MPDLAGTRAPACWGRPATDHGHHGRPAKDRSSVSYEVEPKYVGIMRNRLGQADILSETVLSFEERP